ncbi:MAG: phage integrase SAM-like domain-containing protein [Bacteroidetes bacterium]|nr:phage integrase SAM-like domain-containing protein [Bacteroidota bacterium]
MKTAGVKEYDFLEVYDKLIRAMASGRKRLPNGNTYRTGTVDNYRYVRKSLENFCTLRSFPMRLRPIKKLSQRELIRERNYWKKFYKKYSDYLLYTMEYHDNSVGFHMKTLRAVFNYANRDLMLGVGEFHRELYVHKEEIPVIILTPERLQFMISDKAFEAGLPGRLRRIKDTLVFGCTVALRYSDLMNLTAANLLRAGDNYYLQVRSQKTKTYTQVKLPDYAIAIAEKNITDHGRLLPKISKFNMNKYLKELTEAAGWTEPVGKYRERKGQVFEIKRGREQYRFCDMVSSHTMRRTAITTMLTLGVPEHIVRSISGHAPMSKEFFKYVGIAQVYKDRELDRMHERLKNL